MEETIYKKIKKTEYRNKDN